MPEHTGRGSRKAKVYLFNQQVGCDYSIQAAMLLNHSRVVPYAVKQR